MLMQLYVLCSYCLAAKGETALKVLQTWLPLSI